MTVRFSKGHHLSFAVTILVVGCVDSYTVQQRVDRVREMIDASRNSGAYKCAPRDLALAVAYVEFGENELSEGDPFWALRHLDEAELHATAAAKRSASPTCARRTSERRTERCRYRDRSGAWVEREGACADLEKEDNSGTTESKDRCDFEVSDSQGYRDRESCLGRDIKSGEQDQEDNRCPSETGQRVNAVCLKKYNNIVITANAIRLKRPILFEERHVKISTESNSILDEIADFLLSNPQITVEIQGHTDSAGNDDFNLTLSQKRADSVRGYLIRKGIAPTRLLARGYGETSPIESNHTSRGRTANRRIEIIRKD